MPLITTCTQCEKKTFSFFLRNGICKKCIEINSVAECRHAEKQNTAGCRTTNSTPKLNEVEAQKLRRELTQLFMPNTTQVYLNLTMVENIRKTFIAFDVETTGLSNFDDRIIEIGAVRFVDGKPAEYFSTLINTDIPVSAGAYVVNHISDEMLAAAPDEADVYPRFINFLGDAMNGEILMCAHNAKFDFGFLDQTFYRLGYTSKIKYIDTLQLSRRYVDGVSNYKQDTIAKHFHIQNAAEHRAETDAETCGKILLHLLKYSEADLQSQQRRNEQYEWMQSALVYWTSGETARKNGDFEEAFKQYDKAKAIEHAPWFLYEGYAKAYRKLKDYNRELDILNEGIACIGNPENAQLVSRREKVLNLISAKEAADRAEQEKVLAKARRLEKKLLENELATAKPKQPCGKAVIQMDDNGTIIKEFATIAAAAKEVGVDNKGIRNAANGIQKHAGGFCWKFKDEE